MESLLKIFLSLLLCFVTATALAADPQVALQTNRGTIVLELYPAKAPQTVANFLGYVKAGHYNGTIFHRVIDGFMIQGGGFTPDMQQKTTRAPIENEAANGLKNRTGSIAMARTRDPHSATAQFFINVNDNTSLDYTSPTMGGYGYAVFGKVVRGMEVVEAIAKLPTTRVGPYADVPGQPVVIESATLVSTPQ
ncbi:MAG TPA: peptidylprolyl isomerase [Burkholderiales bacterium]